MFSSHARLIAPALTVLTTLATPAVQAQSTGLFAPVSRAVTTPERLADVTVRSRAVTIDLGRLRRAQAVAASLEAVRFRALSPRGQTRVAAPAPNATLTTLTLNLFHDTVVTGVVEWTDPTFSGGYSLSGRLVEDPLGTMTLVVNGERVVGSVRTADGTYRIRSVAEGLYAVSEVEEPPLRCGVEGPHPETADHRH